jgi:hypothetical protein
MFSGINWAQGWVIIIMVFAGIVLLKHYEELGEKQIATWQKQSAEERAVIIAQLDGLLKSIANKPIPVGCVNTPRWGP